MENEYYVRISLKRLWQTHRILTEEEARRIAGTLGFGVEVGS